MSTTQPSNHAPTRPIRAVLFDLDDTLWPIVPVIRQAEQTLHVWLQQHVPSVAEQWSIESLRERRVAMMLENPNFQIDLYALRHAGLTEAFIASNADTAMVDHAMQIFAHARNAVTPFDDVVPALTRMGRSWRLGSISNGFADLQAIGLASHFGTSLAAHRFGSAKPDPAIFHAACAALEVDPAHAVYVGDDLRLDVEASQNAGLRAVWINRFDRTLPPTIRPDAVCTTLLELEDWLAAAPRRA
ncbi:MAG: HAD family hydrolase [Herminiimonas sp.]|nr:HAD family hydrolase [Herminiimonas sp.]